MFYLMTADKNNSVTPYALFDNGRLKKNTVTPSTLFHNKQVLPLMLDLMTADKTAVLPLMFYLMAAD